MVNNGSLSETNQTKMSDIFASKQIFLAKYSRYLPISLLNYSDPSSDIYFNRRIPNCTTVVERAGHLIEPEIRLNSPKK